MRKSRLPVKDISGGEFTSAPPLAMKPRYSRLLQNYYITAEGHIRKIPGFSPASQLIEDCQISTGIDFKKSDGTSILLLGGRTDSGLSRNTVSFTASTVIPAAVFAGVGLNDLTTSGAYTGNANATFVVQIVNEAAPANAIRWSKNGGDWNYDFIPDPVAAFPLSDGVFVTFASPEGHTTDDSWTISIIYPGLDDMAPSGVCSQVGGAFFEVVIDTVGAPDKFKWRKDGGAWTAGVSITGAAQLLSDSVSITFGATTGHSYGSTWEITAGTTGGCVYRLDNGVLSVVKSDFASLNKIYFAQIGDRVVFSNGVDRPVIYDGANIANINLPFKNTVEFTGSGVNDMAAVISYVLVESTYDVEIDAVAQVPVVTFDSLGINDLQVPNPDFSGDAASAVFNVEIDNPGSKDTFKYNINGGLYTSGIEVKSTVATANIVGGIHLKGTNTTGHNVNDVYEVRVTEVTSPTAKFQWRKNAGAWSAETNLSLYPTYASLDGEWSICVDSVAALVVDDVLSFQCDGSLDADSFKWQKDGGAWTEGVLIAVGDIDLGEGVKVRFNYMTGHTFDAGKGWEFTVTRDTVKYRTGTGAYTAGVLITTANQEITPGINFKFATRNGHTLGDKWHIPIEQGARLGKGYPYKNRLWHISNEDMLVFHSALLNPVDFSTADDAGYIDFKYVLPKGDVIVDISSVLSTIVFFFNNHIAIYSGSDPTLNGDFALYQMIEGIGAVAPDCVVRVGNDIFFLSSLGVKSLKQIINLGSLNVESVSAAIDKDIIAAIAANASGVYGSAHYPDLGLVLFLVGSTIFIYNYNKQAWTRMVLPTVVDDAKVLGMFTAADGKLYFGGYDYLLEFDPATTTYNFNGVAPTYKWNTAYYNASESDLFFTDMVTRLATFNAATLSIKVKVLGTDIDTEDQTAFNEQSISVPAAGAVNDEVMNYVNTPLYGAGKYVQICYTETPNANANSDMEFSGLEIRGEVSEGL
jgi:hypothetical protein